MIPSRSCTRIRWWSLGSPTLILPTAGRRLISQFRLSHPISIKPMASEMNAACIFGQSCFSDCLVLSLKKKWEKILVRKCEIGNDFKRFHKVSRDSTRFRLKRWVKIHFQIPKIEIFYNYYTFYFRTRFFASGKKKTGIKIHINDA